jgi:hypothetical protein
MSSRSERIPDEYQQFYTKAGQFIREWAEFELTLSWPLAALLGSDEFRARVILGSLRSFDAKRRIILQLSATFADKATDAFLVETFTDAKRISHNRNMIAHQLGGVSDRVSQLVFISDVADPDIGTDFLSERKIDQNSITTWCREIAVLRGKIIDFFGHHHGRAKVYALPKMHREQHDGQTDETPDRQSATPE